MTTNNEEFEIWFNSSMRDPTIGITETNIESACESAWQAATTEANKRIAELEASNNILRDGISEIAAEAQDTYTNAALTKLISATPAESLQAFENEVIEKCAKVCDHVNQQYSDIFKDTKDRFNDGASYGADDCAECLRSLKEVK